MATVRETVLQGVREWLLATANYPTALTDKQVVPYQAAGVRPPLPYLAVKVGPVATEGEDERIASLTVGGAPQSKYRGERSARVTVYGFGEGSDEWIVNAIGMLGSDTALALLDNGAKIAVDNLPGPVDVSAVIDSSYEYRYVQELVATFRNVTGPEVHVELLTTVTTTDLDDLDPTITVPTT
jgi:hypothetical protein